MHLSSVVDLIGNTPLIEIKSLRTFLPESIRVFLKAEWFNPGGSVKDRPARNIVLTAMEQGKLKPGGTLLDASSGNTAIAYAMLGAALGFRVVMCVPQNASPERKRTLIAYGARLILTDPNESSDGAIRQAQKMVREEPSIYFYADQYGNDANWQAHYKTTGPEIAAQTARQISHFVVGLGTSGTCMGVGRFMRDHLPDVKIIAFQPDSPFHGLEGLKHMETAIVPKIYNDTVPHQHKTCVTERAYTMARHLARHDGLFVGISTGAALAMAIDVGQDIAKQQKNACIVALAPDGGSRYLSERFWEG